MFLATRHGNVKETFWKYVLAEWIRMVITRFVFEWFAEGKLVIVYQINAPLWYITTCSESESRNFDCQWNWVSFLVRHNQFYREVWLTCPLYSPTEDICIGIFNMWHMLKKSVSMQQYFEQFMGKQRRLEGKYFGIFEADPLRFDCVNQFSPQEQRKAQFSLIYEV